MPDTQTLYDRLLADSRRTALLASCGGLLGWDEQTYLPPGGAAHRAEQSSLLAGLVHEWATSPERGELLAKIEAEQLSDAPDGPMAANVRELRRDYDRATKLSRRLVEELSRVTSLAQQAWVQARKQADFKQFLPWLEQVVALKREEAQALGSKTGVPYDALLDQYEADATAAEVARAFASLRDELVRLVNKIRDSGRVPDVSLLARRYPIDAQRKFATEAARAIGFDLDSGRIDEAAHPFCSGIGPGDCRLTTRYDEHHFPGAFFGVLHEAGHGIYDQGLDPAQFGTPMGESVSLGVHESQSRMWENRVGRSFAFWRHFHPRAQAAFPEALSDVPLEDFHAAINDVRPTFIRVEADEVTYNLHIMLRFELEQPLISGDLSPADVPAAWNEKFAAYLGPTPPSDVQGCLQDIHWSAGLIGYFPTYALGNMYAAQLFDAAERELGDLDVQFAEGEFRPLTEWLSANIHRRGRQFPPARLLELVTGEKPTHAALVRQLRAKFAPLYGL
ncbi:MAG: carboxypeptidase M32 [Planctomycetaceae bacterium]